MVKDKFMTHSRESIENRDNTLGTLGGPTGKAVNSR